MLRIRESQLATFVAEHRRNLLQQLAAHTGGSLSTAEDLVARAESFGLSTYEDHRAFADLESAHGPMFENLAQNSWMRAVLDDRSVALPSRRLARLLDKLRTRRSVEQENAAAAAEFASENAS